MARTYIIVGLATIALASGFQINGFGQHTGPTNVRYHPPSPPPPSPLIAVPPGNIKDRIKVQPPAVPSFNLRAVSIIYYLMLVFVFKYKIYLYTFYH